MSHLLLWVLWKFEESLRPRPRDLIPELNELEGDPVGYLSSSDGVHVGPRTYPVVAVLSAVPATLLTGLFGWTVSYLFFLNAGQVLAASFGLSGLVMGPLAVWRLNRGGDAHIVPSGVVFSKGKSAVVCPWDAFDPWSELRAEPPWAWLPLSVPESQRITETFAGALRRSGAAVDTPFASAVRPGMLSRLFGGAATWAPPERLKVRDAYAVRGSELFPLLMRIAEAAQLAAARRRADRVGTLLSENRPRPGGPTFTAG